jgi:TAT (twin-arginine translocation) pathway signal sequence
MNRRKFLKWLGVGVAGAAVAPSALSLLEPACVAEPATFALMSDAIVGEYFNYVNFSSFALATAIDESVQNAAAELGLAHARRIDALYKTVAFGG